MKNSQVKSHDSRPSEDIQVGQTQGEGQGEGAICYWEGTEYSEGATVCDNGNLMRCYADGTWSVVGTC